MPKILAGAVVDVYPFRVIEDRSQYLALKRMPNLPLGNTWQVVHARIERKETAVRAAVRELKQQTGLTPTGMWNIDYVNSFFSPEEDVVFLVPSIGVLVDNNDDVSLTPEHVSWEWVSSTTALKRFMWVGQRLAIQTLQEEIAGPMADNQQPNPYLEIDAALYTPPKRGRR
ncbi:MAG: NUDIX domain-containing protein [Chloroflexia bacterium]